MPKSSSPFPNTSDSVIEDIIFPHQSYLESTSRGDNPCLMVSLSPSGQTRDFDVASLFLGDYLLKPV